MILRSLNLIPLTVLGFLALGPVQAQVQPATAKPANIAASDHGPINWTTMEQAQELSKKDGKPILVDVYTQWCGPCKMLSSKTFTDKQLADYVNKNYHAVKFDAEGPDPVKFNGQNFTILITVRR
jgi:thiol:disulfide interchange protein